MVACWLSEAFRQCGVSRRVPLSADPLDGMIEIRTAQESDLLIVSQWLRNQTECEMWAGHRVLYPIDLPALPDAIQWTESDSWVVTLREEVAAFGQLVPKPGGRFHIARLIVAPDHRAEGLGRRLTEHLLATAVGTEASGLSLNVFADNYRAIALYHSLGFSETDRPADEPESLAVYMTYAV